MRYNEYFKSYTADIKIREGDRFKFIVNETYKVSEYYAIDEVLLLENPHSNRLTAGRNRITSFFYTERRTRAPRRRSR